MKAFRFVGLGTAMVLGLMALAWQEGTPPPRPPEPPRPERPNRPPPTPVPPPMTQDADIEVLRREAHDAEASGNAERAKELHAIIQKLQDDRARRQDRPNQDRERMAAVKRLEEELRAAKPDSPRFRELQEQLAELRGPGRMPKPEDMKKQIEDLMESIKQLDPATAANIQRLVAEGRFEEAFRMAQDMRARSRELKEMQERDPEGYKKMMEARAIEKECEELGHALRKAPADKKAELKGKLEKVVARLFDLREEMRAKELEDLKKRIDELNGLLAKRKASRDKIVERRVRQLSGEPDELDW